MHHRFSSVDKFLTCVFYLLNKSITIPISHFFRSIDAAKLLLLNREYPVETVANMTGYAGANYFCKVFRRLTGESPGEYRARASAPFPGRDLPRLDAFEGVHYV